MNRFQTNVEPPARRAARWLLVVAAALLIGPSPVDRVSVPVAGAAQARGAILQGADVERLVAIATEHGWEVTHRLELIDAIAVRAAPRQVPPPRPCTST